MRENLAPVRCAIQEKNANLDVEIIRRDRAILYRVRPRKVLTVRQEASKWKRPAPVTQVEELINIALERNARQSSTKVVCLCFSFVVCVVVIETSGFVNSLSLHRVYKAIPRAKIYNSYLTESQFFLNFLKPWLWFSAWFWLLPASKSLSDNTVQHYYGRPGRILGAIVVTWLVSSPQSCSINSHWRSINFACCTWQFWVTFFTSFPQMSSYTL